MKIIFTLLPLFLNSLNAQNVVIKSKIDSSLVINSVIHFQKESKYLSSSKFNKQSFVHYQSIIIEHISYESYRYFLNSSDSIIFLLPKTYTGLNDTIEAKSNTHFKRVQIDPISKKTQTLGQLLSRSSQISISSYGGSGSLTEMKSIGLSGHHSAVLIEGFKINNAQNSIVNLNLIPLIHFDQIDIYSQGSNVSKTKDAIAGGIDLKVSGSKQNSIELQSTLGSYGLKKTQLSAGVIYKETNLSISYQKESSDNYFPYKKNLNETAYRNHSDYELQNTSISLDSRLNDELTIKSIFIHSMVNSGTPGPKRNLTSSFEKGKIRQIDQSNMFIISTVYKVYEKHTLNVGFQYQPEELTFNKSAKYSNLKVSIHLEDQFYLDDSFFIKNYIEFERYHLKGNTGSAPINSDRKKYALGSKINFIPIDDLILTASFQKDFIEQNLNPMIYNVNSSYQLINRLSLSFSFASQKRIPTFNELYWPQSGNKNLKPEKSIMRSIGFNYKSKMVESKVSYFSNSFFDFIEWELDEISQLTVNNVNFYKQKGFHSNFQLDYHTINFSLDFTHQTFKNKQKVRYYTPINILSSRLGYHFNSLHISVQYRITDNYLIPNVLKQAPIRHQLNGSIYYEYNLSTFLISTFINSNNLLNIISQPHIPYPEQNRNFQFGLGLRFNFKE